MGMDCKDIRRRCHELLDELGSSDLEARVYRFIKYLYIHDDKSAAPVVGHRDGKAEQIVTPVLPLIITKKAEDCKHES